MANLYSQDLRERMAGAVRCGRPRHEVARMFNVSASCVIKLTQRAAAAGSRESRKFGGRKRYCLGRHEDALWDTIGFALDDFSAKECFNYFRNAGYGSV